MRDISAKVTSQLNTYHIV